MDLINNLSKGLGTGLQENQSTIKNIVIAISTVGGGQVFHNKVFVCPCTNRVIYGLTYMFAPAVILLCLGVLINNTTWRLVTGCCRIHSVKDKWQKGRRVGQIVVKACLAPSAWIFISLLKGEFYGCGQSTVPCQNANDKVVVSNEDKAISQMFGWILAVVGVLIIILTYCLSRSFGRFTYAQRQYAMFYSAAEKQLFEIKAKELAKKEADINTEKFFDQQVIAPAPLLTNDEWRDMQNAWDTVTVIGSCRGGGRGYTPLYHWAKFGSDGECVEPASTLSSTSLKGETVELLKSECHNVPVYDSTKR
ncbi:calcium homeostasis modulator protein 6-like [Saccoglossus kowalevskii]